MNLIGQIRRHSGWVYSVALSPDASLIASCSNDRTVRIFQAASVASDSDSCASVVLNGHSHAIRCCAFNANGSRLATASWDGDVRIWDVVSGDCVRAISAAAGGNRVYSCAWAAPVIGGSEVLATAGGGGAFPADFSVRIWDIAGNEDASAALICRVLVGHSKAVTCLAFDADGLRLLSSSDDHTVC
jgi:WD40 repeat protein